MKKSRELALVWCAAVIGILAAVASIGGAPIDEQVAVSGHSQPNARDGSHDRAGDPDTRRAEPIGSSHRTSDTSPEGVSVSARMEALGDILTALDQYAVRALLFERWRPSGGTGGSWVYTLDLPRVFGVDRGVSSLEHDAIRQSIRVHNKEIEALRVDLEGILRDSVAEYCRNDPSVVWLGEGVELPSLDDFLDRVRPGAFFTTQADFSIRCSIATSEGHIAVDFRPCDYPALQDMLDAVWALHERRARDIASILGVYYD